MTSKQRFIQCVAIALCWASTVLASAKNPLNSERAYAYLKKTCDLGPRPAGSAAMVKQREMLAEHFKALGGFVRLQKFQRKHPLYGRKVPMANLIVEWHPDKKRRLLICAHYDTRPQPDNEPDPLVRRNGKFIGANDGGSGVAVLMELGHLMSKLDSKYGIDFVFFDAEELVYGHPLAPQRGEYFLGSEHFAEQYLQNSRGVTYRWGVLLDMVGDKDLQIYAERNSYNWPDTQPLVKDIWRQAQKLGVKEFRAQVGYEIRDDHLPLRNTAKIPTCDIIDFDYPKHPNNVYWHSTQDTPENCSGESLAKVGWVVFEWMKIAH